MCVSGRTSVVSFFIKLLIKSGEDKKKIMASSFVLLFILSLLMPSDPGRGKVVAPIVRFKNANDKLAHSSAVLVSSDEMKNFFVRHEYFLLLFVPSTC